MHFTNIPLYFLGAYAFKMTVKSGLPLKPANTQLPRT
uniref:Uncharacterized protein n=1 Tax=Anguilla anguilla TaxID=7936 RepID=A0A0E9V9Z0_ANGAN